MASEDSQADPHLRYEPDESPPARLALGLALQQAVLCLAGIVITPTLVIRAADFGGSSADRDAYMAWAVFAAVLVSGICTAIQAARVGRLGAGYVLAMGSSGAFIGVCIAAISQGGPGLMATLVILSSLLQFGLAFRLDLFRKVFTPTVCGTVIMLIPVTVMHIVFEELDNVPEGASPWASPAAALATLAAIVAMVTAGRGMLRLWAPVIGIAAGALVSILFGILDLSSVARAGWIGIPEVAVPRIDLGFGADFWTLLPAFVLITMVGAVETIGDAVAIQKVSWRRPRAVDYRAVQGAVCADGLGNLLSGIAGTVPNTTYSTCVPVAELTGVASRRVGILCGACFCLFAFLPKALALVLAIPGPVVAVYLLVLLAVLFVLGLRIMARSGLDHRNTLVCGVSFWVGFGFQNQMIYPEWASGFAGGILQNGMISGGLAAMILSMAAGAAGSRRSRLDAKLDAGAVGSIQRFLGDLSRRRGWDEAMRLRLEAVAEESVLALIEAEQAPSAGRRRLRLEVFRRQDEVELEFVAASGRENLEDRMALLGDPHPGRSLDREVSARVLRSLAASVRHQQYQDTDVMSVQVRFPPRGRGGRIA